MGARRKNEHVHFHKKKETRQLCSSATHSFHLWVLVWLPEQWGNVSPEAHWSQCWPTTPGRHKHWPDSGLHSFPYEPSCEQWQAVDRQRESREKQVHHSTTGVKTLFNQNAANGSQLFSRIWFPIVYFWDDDSLKGRSRHVSHAVASWEKLQIHHRGCQQQDLTRGCGRMRPLAWRSHEKRPERRNQQRRGSRGNGTPLGCYCIQLLCYSEGWRQLTSAVRVSIVARCTAVALGAAIVGKTNALASWSAHSVGHAGAITDALWRERNENVVSMNEINNESIFVNYLGEYEF